MVGAVLVYDGKIIAEGYHQLYGQAHAEVNCLNSVAVTDKALIPQSTLYVSLEPCAHFGKTPPCADLIIKNKIPQVVIGCRDSFAAVAGKGIEKLEQAGIVVTVGICEIECRDINRRFFTFHEKQRPYIILKWAQSCDGKIAPLNLPAGRQVPMGGTLEHTCVDRLFISNDISNRLVHKWRSEEAAILVGTNTALLDDPALTTRLWPGNNPVRLVIDKELKLPKHLKLFDGSVKTIIFNFLKQAEEGSLIYHKLNRDENNLTEIVHALYTYQIQSVIVEGGAKLLQAFIDANLWDEARTITNGQMTIGNGLDAPVIKNHLPIEEQKINNDTISFYKRHDGKQ